jgi:hypothetical protein
MVRRVASHIALDPQGRAGIVTHTARDGSDPQIVEGLRIIANAAPAALAPLMPAAAAEKLTQDYARRTPSISLFALTLGLSKPPREFGVSAYSTQLLPREMKRLSDYAQGAALMADEPDGRMPPLSVVDYAAIDSGVPAPPHVLLICGPDLVSNWDGSDTDASADDGRTPSSAICPRFIPGWRKAWSRRHSIPRCRSGNISTRPAAPSMGSPRRRHARSGAARLVRREPRCRGFIWHRPMPVLAATPAWCKPPAPAPT